MGREQQETGRVRLDKWLWAARFFKTRALAKQAIEGGKVHYNGARAKPSRFVEVGAELRIRQGFDEKVVQVLALSDQRRGAPEAALLYEETQQSRERREMLATQRRQMRANDLAGDRRPDKKGRRQLLDLKARNRRGDEADA